MMNTPILLCRVSWMDKYQGTKGDSIHSSAAFVKRNRYGAEIFNFQRIRGRLYGYFNHIGELRLERLGGTTDDESLDGITVVWCAPHPQGRGVFVVGWYRGATVYRDYNVQPKTPSQRGRLPGRIGPCPFRCTVSAERARLLDTDGRWFKVPDEFVSQSLTRYLDDGSASTIRFKNRLAKLVSGKLKPAPATSKPPRNNDSALKLAVERAARNATWAHFERQGWQLQSVEAEDCGWDLTATRAGSKLHIEVKGRSGSAACAELTPNEYRYFRRRRSEYRLCIVTEALGELQLRTVYWNARSKQWISDDAVPVIKERKAVVISLP